MRVAATTQRIIKQLKALRIADQDKLSLWTFRRKFGNLRSNRFYSGLDRGFVFRIREARIAVCWVNDGFLGGACGTDDVIDKVTRETKTLGGASITSTKDVNYSAINFLYIAREGSR